MTKTLIFVQMNNPRPQPRRLLGNQKLNWKILLLMNYKPKQILLIFCFENKNQAQKKTKSFIIFENTIIDLPYIFWQKFAEVEHIKHDLQESCIVFSLYFTEVELTVATFAGIQKSIEH